MCTRFICFYAYNFERALSRPFLDNRPNIIWVEPQKQKRKLLFACSRSPNTLTKQKHATNAIPWYGCSAVLERPSSQMSYLDHFLKESGGNAATHTVSTLAANLVSLSCMRLSKCWITVLLLFLSNSRHRIRCLNRPSTRHRIHLPPVRLPTIFKRNQCHTIRIRLWIHKCTCNSSSIQWCCKCLAIRWKAKREILKTTTVTACPAQKATLAKIHW